MAEEFLLKNPLSLYNQCLSCYVNNLNYNVPTLDRINQLRFLPPSVLTDIYVKISKLENARSVLLEQLSDWKIFDPLLRFDPCRQKLIHCLAGLRNNIALLRSKFTMHNSRPPSDDDDDDDDMDDDEDDSDMDDDDDDNDDNNDNNDNDDNDMDDDDDDMDDDDDNDESYDNSDELNAEQIEFGLRLGSFLSETGWLSDSIEVLDCVAKKLSKLPKNPAALLVRLDCLQRLLHSQSALCNFRSAQRTFSAIVIIIIDVGEENIPRDLLANIYTQFSVMFFAMSEYDDCHMWSVVAMRQLNSSIAEKIAIDVLRQAAKACVVKCDFQRANLLICQATRRARILFGEQHQKYADTLSDYGFFLLNVDSINQSVNVYKNALEIKRCIFGDRNFHVAIAHGDLSYALYVHEGSFGNFNCAREHVEKAIDIMKDLVPSDHLMLASVNRVKALLLEKIAMGRIADDVDEEDLLEQSEDLHKCALQLSLEMFGKENVQTAKHYDNLGELYGTMALFKKAEKMHKKAIKIKTDLLGPYHYEVGLSLGHLASLYHYDMKKYRKAESLYLRSIKISLRWFGKSYSGLKDDYLGLCEVYEVLEKFKKCLKYHNFLVECSNLRDANKIMNKPAYPEICDESSLEDVKQKFFDLA